jgi:hypothetical protein
LYCYRCSDYFKCIWTNRFHNPPVNTKGHFLGVK